MLAIYPASVNEIPAPDAVFVFIKVQLTPKIIFPLTKSTSFPNYFSEKIISIDKIPAFLQAFKVVIF